MPVPRAVLYMAASALAFSAMAVFVKLANERLPMGEVVLARAVITLAASYVLVVRARIPIWGTNKRGLVFRGLVGFAGLSTYYVSLAHLPLADAMTIQQTVPLITTVFAYFILGEPIGKATVFALACGIVGVVIVVHPSGSGFDPVGVATGVGAAVTSSIAYVTVRQLGRTEHPYVIVFYFPLIATPLIVPWAAATWVTPAPMDVLVLILVGLSTQLGQVFLTKALMIESAGRAMSIGYLQIAFAIVWQWSVFGAAPTVWTLGGAALIVLGTVVVSRAVAGSPTRTPRSPDRSG
ncbi:MAG: DMT family transporter [Kofleriaceae bacterium]|nr:DMT family transporter [Kofleriaceae bacterium]